MTRGSPGPLRSLLAIPRADVVERVSIFCRSEAALPSGYKGESAFLFSSICPSNPLLNTGRSGTGPGADSTPVDRSLHPEGNLIGLSSPVYNLIIFHLSSQVVVQELCLVEVGRSSCGMAAKKGHRSADFTRRSYGWMRFFGYWDHTRGPFSRNAHEQTGPPSCSTHFNMSVLRQQ